MPNAFDLQSIWTAVGVSAFAVIVGYILGYVQSVAPFLPNTDIFRNVAISVLSAAGVVAAAITSGASPNPENVLGAIIVFIGIYNAAKNAHGAGTVTAARTSGGAALG